MLDPDPLNAIPAALRQSSPCHPRGRRLLCGTSVAALRALTAAVQYLNGEVPTLGAAVAACGSNVHYVAAAVVLIKANDTALITQVLNGSVPLLRAAKSVEQAVRLVEAFSASSATERRMFGQAVGPSKLFDDAVVAAL